MRFRKKKLPEHLHGITDSWIEGATITGRYTYQIKRKLAEGGMGQIWLVEPKFGQEKYMAVKNPKSEWVNNDVFAANQIYDRFYKECEAWIKLENHPNIVKCLYVEKVLDLPRIFFEYVSDGNLSSLIYSQKIKSWSILFSVAIQICAGMTHIHNNCLIHLDLKPENILISGTLLPPQKSWWSKKGEDDYTGHIEVKITDFGLVNKVIHDKISRSGNNKDYDANNKVNMKLYESGLVLTHSVLGTPAYMAPEVWDRKYGSISNQTDIYSFGIILFELITGGIRPYELDEAGKKAHPDFQPILYEKMHCEYQIPNVKNYRKDCPDSLVDIINKCLQKDPRDRWHNFDVIKKNLIEVYKQMSGYESSHLQDYEQVNNVWFLDLDRKRRIYSNKVVSLYELGKYDQAIEAFDKSIEIEDSFAKSIEDVIQNEQTNDEGIIYYHKGIFLEKTKRYSEAIEAYDNAFHIYRTMCRSSILFFHHFYEDAFHNNRMPGHQFILESHPRDVIGYYYQGISLDLLSRHSDAIVAFDKAIEISPNFARAYYEKGLVLMKLARYSESIEAFDKALENWSVSIYYFDKFDIDENKAKALEALGRHHEAENIRRTHDVTDQIDESYYESLF